MQEVTLQFQEVMIDRLLAPQRKLAPRLPLGRPRRPANFPPYRQLQYREMTPDLRFKRP